MLVDQDRCRGWRMCVTGCPYKKVYFNHRTGKAEKCTFCFPRVEVGIPTVCSETCVGRLRYIGVVLYDADRVLDAASVQDEQDLYEAQREVLLDPFDPQVQAAAEEAGIPDDWVQAAQRSPVWALINRFEVALPLHPEYRTMPMVWYIPPLSPVVDALKDTGHDGEDAGNLFGAIDSLRIPIEYLAELFTAGDAGRVRDVLARLAAMRSYMRDVNLGRDAAVREIAEAVGMTPRGDRGHAPPAGHREVRRALRHPAGARGARRPVASVRTSSRSWPPSARSTTRGSGHGRLGAVRGVVGWLDADRRGELPRAQAAADLGQFVDPRGYASGSTCSTGTARARPSA